MSKTRKLRLRDRDVKGGQVVGRYTFAGHYFVAGSSALEVPEHVAVHLLAQVDTIGKPLFVEIEELKPSVVEPPPKAPEADAASKGEDAGDAPTDEKPTDKKEPPKGHGRNR